MRKFLKIQAYGGADPVFGGSSLPVLRLEQGSAAADLVGESGCMAVVLADCRGGRDLQHLHHLLSLAEARLALAEGTVKILACAADSASGMLALASLAGKSPRLAGLIWGRHAFARDVGCDPQSATAELARLHLVIAAGAVGVAAYDSADDGAGGLSEVFVATSRHLGFRGVALPA